MASIRVSVSCGLAQMSCSHRPHTHVMSWHTLSKVCAQAVPATQRVQCHCSFAGYLYERRTSGSSAESRPSEVSTGRLCPSSYPKIPGRRISLTSPSLMMQPWPTRALSPWSRVIGLMRGLTWRMVRLVEGQRPRVDPAVCCTAPLVAIRAYGCGCF